MVTVTGPGIAPEHLHRIFDRFYRVEGSRSRAQGGAGLGLAIALMLADLQGGRLLAESEPERGSRFVLELPAASPPSAKETS
ncbi:MAG: ATP-binding protein [Gemmatimonadales bacterium]